MLPEDRSIPASGPGEEAIPEAGSVVGGRYVVEGLLGRGGMSIVLRARDSRLGHVVALKLLRGSSHRRTDHSRRFLREAQTIARLRSDHVVNVLDVDTASDPPYLAMELLEGQTVAELLATHGRFSVETALRIVAQATRGVADAHALGVMHRDLKPSNLIVTRAADGSQRVKVIDFGISKPFVHDSNDPGLTSTGEILGSPRYMSPEQVRAGGKLDARSDIWALGAILYELIAGVSPFEAPTVADTLARIVRDAPVPLQELAPGVPQRVASIVALCLSKDPALRPPDVRALLEEVEAVTPRGALSIDELPPRDLSRTTSATTLGTDVRSVKLSRPAPPRRSRRLAVAVAAWVAASAGVAAVWVGPWAAQRPPSAVPPSQPVPLPPPPAAAAPPSATAVAPPIETTQATPSPPAAVPATPSMRRPPAAVRAKQPDAGATDEDLELHRRN